MEVYGRPCIEIMSRTGTTTVANMSAFGIGGTCRNGWRLLPVFLPDTAPDFYAAAAAADFGGADVYVEVVFDFAPCADVNVDIDFGTGAGADV